MHSSWMAIIATCALATSLSSAQTGEINPDKIMDAAFDLKKAAERADELKVDAAKYCSWGRPRMDASDLSDAIARHLLNHGSHVPQHVAASQMWHVSFTAGDLLRELDSIGTYCALSREDSPEANDLFLDSSSFASRFRNALAQFEDLAASQTLWQEKGNLGILMAAQKSEGDHIRSHLQGVQQATQSLKESEDAAIQASSRNSRKRADCYDDELSSPDLTSLSALLNDFERYPNYFLQAGTLIVVQGDAELSELVFVTAENLCLRRPNKKARQAGVDISKARTRLARSIVDFESLLARQVEWEESILKAQVAGEEH